MNGTYDVAPAVLDWVIGQVGSDPTPLNALPLLNEWKRGIKSPTFNEIKTVSRKTRIPLGYFFLQRPPTETIRLMEYRTIINTEFETPSRELVDTISDMENIVDWTRSYLESNHYEANPIVGVCKGQSDSTAIADTVRYLLGLSINWFEQTDNSFTYLCNKMSEKGVIIMMNGIVRENTHRPLNIEEFRAFTIIDEYAPLIFINAADAPHGRLFSLLHEFTHVCLGRDNLFNDRYCGETSEAIEMLCNAVAAEIIAPSIPPNTSPEPNHTASPSQYPSDHHHTSRIDRRLFSFIIDSVAQGRTLYSEAFRLTGTNRHTFFEFFLATTK